MMIILRARGVLRRALATEERDPRNGQGGNEGTLR